MSKSRRATALGSALILVPALSVGAALGQAPASDKEIQAAVSAALTSDAQLKGQQITATVSKGVVTLNGSVNDDAARLAAEQTAAQVAGVKSIEDNVSVGSAQASNAAPQAEQQLPPPLPEEQPQARQQLPPPPPEEQPQPSQYPAQQGQYPQQQGQYPQGQGQYAPQQGQYPQQQGQYPPQPGYQQPYGYQPPPPRPLLNVTEQRQDTSGPVIVPAGTLLTVRTSQPLSASKTDTGTLFQVSATGDIYENGVVAIPRGATLTAQVVESRKAGTFGGSPRLDLKLATLTLGGQTYNVDSDVWSNQGPNKAGYTAGNAVGGAALGAVIGAIAGGGVGAGVGAVAGGATGTVISGATPGPRLGLPPETVLQFRLTSPLEVQPVKYDEAMRLAASMPQQPVLQRRPVYVVAPRPYYAYPYPYVYYPRYYRPGYYY